MRLSLRHEQGLVFGLGARWRDAEVDREATEMPVQTHLADGKTPAEVAVDERGGLWRRNSHPDQRKCCGLFDGVGKHGGRRPCRHGHQARPHRRGAVQGRPRPPGQLCTRCTGGTDPAEFTRVADFVVRGGNSEEGAPSNWRFLMGPAHLPAEFDAAHIHTRGALAMSRLQRQPGQALLGLRFHCHRPQDWPAGVGQVPARPRRELHGGPGPGVRHGGRGAAPGQRHGVWRCEGMDVVDKLAATPGDESDWPLTGWRCAWIGLAILSKLNP